MRRLSQLLNEEEETSLNKKELDKILLIEIDHIRFSYKNNMILKDLKLKIKKDEKVVIFGKNGCGKTTLMSILLRLEKPDDGKIVVNGYDIEMIGLEYYRKCIAAVLTDFYLINDSIINIIIDKDMEADEKKVKKIVDVCGLTDLITQRGYAYNVGENGEKLSAGQKQKICLARALISNRDLLFWMKQFQI